MSNIKPDSDIFDLLETDINKGFRLVVDKYSTRLYWHIRRLVILHEDTDDALRNTFVNAWRNISNFRSESSLYTWLYAIATNEALALINKRARNSAVSFDDLGSWFANSAEGSTWFDADIAFFTKRLELTPDEAEKFWPVYNEYKDLKIKIQLERQELNRNFNQNGLNMSDREMTEAGDRFIGLEVREAALAQEFHNKIKTILPPVKVLKLYQAENQYRLQLLKELQERREGRNNQNIRQQ